MDPYLLNSAGLSADDDALLYSGIVPPGVKQRALAAQVRRSPLQMPSTGVEAPRPAQTMPAPSPPPGMTQGPDMGASAPPAGSTLPEGPLALRRAATEAALRAADEAGKMPDTTAMQDAYRRRFEGAGPDIGLAMFLGSRGGKMGAQMGPAIFKQALEAREPMKTPYGTIDYEQGFTADPFKAREFEVQRLDRKATILEQQATHAETAEERHAARVEANRLRELQLQIHRDQMRMQGANLAEAQALRRQQFEQGKWLKVKDDSGAEYYVNSETGAEKGRSSSGGLNVPKLNDSQGKAVAFGMRAAESARQLESLGTDYSSASVAAKGGLERLPKVGGLLGSAYNFGMGQNEQLAEQAQRNFVNAILRRESGAVINAEEFSNARQQYFPQPGDSEAVLAQKKINRDTAIRGLMIEAGPGARFVNEAINPQQQQPGQSAPRSALPRATGQPVSARARSFMD